MKKQLSVKTILMNKNHFVTNSLNQLFVITQIKY